MYWFYNPNIMKGTLSPAPGTQHLSLEASTVPLFFMVLPERCYDLLVYMGISISSTYTESCQLPGTVRGSEKV